jgi:SAM-dependent methyltransferase
MDRTLYPGVEDHWDDQAFRRRILRWLGPERHVLDLGAGSGIVTQMDFKGLACRVCGVDPDPRVVQNPYLDEGKVGLGEKIPYADETFDVVFADNVLEHMAEPALVFSEVYRVLRTGGAFLMKTPNRAHYVPTIARLTPHRFHEWVNRLRGRHEADTFPTRYRANTPRVIHRLSADAGFREVSVELMESRPEYTRINPATYVVGWLYERAVNNLSPLRRFRVLLIAEVIK